MSKLSFKKVPVKEQQTAQHWRYPKDLFSAESDYFEALRSSEIFVRKVRPSIADAEWSKLRTLLVHECEMAKQWRSLWDSGDDPQRATAEWIEGTADSLRDLAKLIRLLRKKDSRIGYDLREVFFRSSQIALSPDVEKSAVMSDGVGSFEVPTGGRVARAVEIQLLARLFEGQFPAWLDALESEVHQHRGGFNFGRRIGPMFLDPPMSERSIKERDATQLAILALTARLHQALGRAIDLTKPIPNYESLSTAFGGIKRNSWPIVHQLIRATFKISENELDVGALKQRWSSAIKQRKITFSNWPQPVERHGS